MVLNVLNNRLLIDGNFWCFDLEIDPKFLAEFNLTSRVDQSVKSEVVADLLGCLECGLYGDRLVSLNLFLRDDQVLNFELLVTLNHLENGPSWPRFRTIILKFPFKFDELTRINFLVSKVGPTNFLGLEFSNVDWRHRLGLGFRYGYIILLWHLLLLVHRNVFICAVESFWRLTWMSNFEHRMWVRWLEVSFAFLT